jgi:hypothetical protein
MILTSNIPNVIFEEDLNRASELAVKLSKGE